MQRGFGGSTFADVNAFVDEIVLPYEPAAVFPFAGTNDVAVGRSAAQVFADYLAFVSLVRAGQPSGVPPLPIVYIGITPTPARGPPWPVASQVNAQVEAHAAGDPSLHYADTPPAFLATGSPPAASLFQADGLHLSAEGYALWEELLVALAGALVAPAAPRVAPVPGPLQGTRVLLDLGPSNEADGRPTASPGPFGQHWENWNPVLVGSSIPAGEHRGGLLSTGGAPTGIGLVITGELSCNGIRNGGLLEPDPGLLGRFAVATATADYVYADDGFLPGGFLFRGLDPRRHSVLTFFATRDSAERRVTRYRVCGSEQASTTLVTSGPGSGSGGALGNDDTLATLAGLRPDPLGRLFVDLEREAGAFAYAGIVELVVGPLAKEHPAARAPGQ